MRIAMIATPLLVLPLLSCSADPRESPTAHPSPLESAVASPQTSSPVPVTPPPVVRDELARYEYDGSVSASTHSTKAAKAGIEYALKAACSGPGEATFTVSKAGIGTFARVTIPCNGVATLNGMGTSMPGPPVQVDANVGGASSAWAVVAPIAALH